MDASEKNVLNENAESELREEEVFPSAEDKIELETSERDFQAELDALKGDLLRAMAETENVRKRAAREREEALKYGVSGFARDLTSVSENFTRALESIPTETLAENDALRALFDGVSIIAKELLTVFERHGVKKISPFGEKFDHNFHQAMLEIHDATQPAGTIVQVLQSGFVIHDRLLKPALVGVAKAPAQ